MDIQQPLQARSVAATGASGLIGSSIVRLLADNGWRVIRLSRQHAANRLEGAHQNPNPVVAHGSPVPDKAYWNPATGELDRSKVEGLDAFIHLAGESIMGRWTAAKKQGIRDSRVAATKLLCESLAGLSQPPRVLLCASAVGYYGDGGSQELDEDSPAGDGFLADVCRQWEQSCQPARDAGIRVLNLRFGMVLSGSGGALKQMLLPFKLGLGGPIGGGQQYISWITLADVAQAILHLLTAASVDGPVNLTAPHPVTNREFTRALGKALNRPAILPLPAFAVKALLGEMGTTLLLSSQRVLPRQLLDSGYQFKHSTLAEGLRAELSKPSS